MAAAEVDDAFVRRAAAQADPGALRMALLQQTGDAELAAIKPVRRPVRGGGMTMLTVAREDRATLADKLLDYVHAGDPPFAAVPSPDELSHLLALFGTPIDDPVALSQAAEELAFEPHGGALDWDGAPPPAATLAQWPVAIVGCGISGIAAAIQLKRLGLPFTIYDRQPRIGGTWASNVYPEARVDIPNSVYQYKFERDHPWRDHFSPQAELQSYLQGVAERHGLMEHIRLGVDVEGGVWWEDDATWRLRLRTADGTRETASARVVFSASGLFGAPRRPHLEGLDEFQGPIVHTTRWEDVPLAGRQVALIGTGSSGAQLMPHLAREAKHLTVYQRTPNWVLPMNGYHAQRTPEQQWLARALPAYWHWQNYTLLLLDREIEHLQQEDAAWREGGGQVSERNDALRTYLTAHLREHLADRPDLLAKSLPNYAPAARRLVVDNGWYDALLRPNVTLADAPIREVEADAIVTRDGERHATDVILLGTGFETDRYLWPAGYEGRDGVTPEGLWTDGARAYLGLTLPGLPNFVMMYGPHGQPRSGAFHDWAVRWARYAAGLIVASVRGGATSFALRGEAFDRYNDEVEAAGHDLIWGKHGAGSYYLDARGRLAVNMPWRAADYYRRILKPDLDDYELR